MEKKERILNKVRWQAIQDILMRALEIPEEKRPAFLEQACGDDESLRRDVIKYLEVDDDTLIVFDQTFNIKSDFPSGSDKFHSYRILNELGRGGMGVVYLAEHEFQKRVAIKVLKRGLDTDEFVRRFHQERKILARLKHPNIAAIFDGGALDDARPYLVMEYVDGIPLQHFCNRNQLDIKERFKLFRKVCNAVSYAHRNLVVHRDLKPGNILVTPSGEPKLLDFGIARLLSGKPDETLPLTTGHRFLTPEYASPEQLANRAVTTLSDVYSLGVILFELLCDQRPNTLEKEAVTMGAHVRFKTIPGPSKIIRNQKDVKRTDAASIAEQRGTEPGRLVRLLSGDPDRIVLGALRKEPEERYASVDLLNEDIERYLNGYPIHAGRKGRFYYARKFLLRYRLGVAVTAFVLMLVSVFATSLYLQKQQVLQERDKSRELVDILTGALSISDPRLAGDNRIRLETLLDHMARDVQQAGDPDIRILLLETLGKAYVNLECYSKAVPLLEEITVNHPMHGDPSLLIRAGNLLVDAYINMGKLGDAENTLRWMREEPITRLAPDNSLLITTLISEADWNLATSHLEKAGQAYEKAIRNLSSLAEPNEMNLWRAYNGRALVAYVKGDLGRAAVLSRETVRFAKATFGDESLLAATSLDNLGTAYRRLGKHQEALGIFQGAHDIRSNILDPGSPALAYSYLTLGFAYAQLWEFEKAEPLLETSREIIEIAYGEGSFSSALFLEIIGLHHEWQGNLEEADALYRKVRLIRESHLAPDHILIAQILNNQGRLALIQGFDEEAETCLNRAAIIWEANLGPENPKMAWVNANLARLYQKRRDYPVAEALFGKALEIKQTSREYSIEYAAYLELLANLYVDWQKYAEAESLYVCALHIKESLLSQGHPLVGKTLYHLVKLKQLMGHDHEADAILSRIWEWKDFNRSAWRWFEEKNAD